MCFVKPGFSTTDCLDNKEGQTICQHDFIDRRNTKSQ